jgi:glycosyltransferase involved in cell wall biosynthesis
MKAILLKIPFCLNFIKSKRWQRLNKQHIPVIDHVYISANCILIVGWANTDHNVEVRVTNLNKRMGEFGTTTRCERRDLVGIAGPKAGFESLFFLSESDRVLEKQEVSVEVYINDQVARLARKISLRTGYNQIRNHITHNFFEGRCTLDDAVQLLLPCLKHENTRLSAVPCSYEVIYSVHQTAEPADLLIVIPLYGNIGLIEHQLLFFALSNFSANKYKIEIVFVIDDPKLVSHAKSKITLLNDYVVGLPISVIANEQNYGFAVACNAGFGFKKSDFTLFWNSDLFATDPNLLTSVLETLFSDESIVAASPVLCNPDGVVQTTALEKRNHPEHKRYLIVESSHRGMPYSQLELDSKRVNILSGGALIVRSEIFSKIGGFPTHYGKGDFEDAELTMRLSKFGSLKVLPIPVYHLLGLSFKRNLVETFCRSLMFSDFCTEFEEMIQQ